MSESLIILLNLLGIQTGEKKSFVTEVQAKKIQCTKQSVCDVDAP